MYYFFSLLPVKHIISMLFNFSALSECILGAVSQALQKRTSEEASVGKDKALAAAFACGFLHPHPSRGQADSPAVLRTFCASSVLLLTSSSAHSDPLSLTSSERWTQIPCFLSSICFMLIYTCDPCLGSEGCPLETSASSFFPS